MCCNTKLSLPLSPTTPQLQYEAASGGPHYRNVLGLKSYLVLVYGDI